MTGRPRIPTKLKIIQGTLEKSRVLESEFEPESVESLQPIFLETDYELAEFKKITGELSKYGLLAEIDLSLIESYCVEYAKYRTAIEVLRVEGLTKVGKMGEYINPHHMIAERSFDRMYKLGVMFGLTPAGRSKVQGNKKPNKGLENLLNGTGT
jgi:P27 family predicted phage terminase small subunit